MIPTTSEIFAGVGGAKYFTRLDAVKGFHQIPLDEQSSKLTNFVTPFGKYRFLRMPMGISVAPEIFHRTMADILAGVPGVAVYIDDILVYGSTLVEHNSRLRQVLRKCQEAGLTLSKQKSVFCKSRVDFLGHELTNEGIRPKSDKLVAVERMLEPKDKREAERFLGFVTYLAKFIPNLAKHTQAIRDVCKKYVNFSWNVPQQSAFAKIKQLILQSPTLAIYDDSKPLTVSVDASSNSLAACLMQDGKPIEFASKSLSPCQRNYAQIEKELLAVYFGCSRFHLFTYARSNVTIETDHKPLIGLIKKDVNTLSPRLAGLRLKLMPYSNCELKWRPGKELIIADTLSRTCPAGSNVEDDLKNVSTVLVSRVNFLDDVL